MMEGTPHRAIDSIADGVADGIKGVIGSIANAVKGAGETVMRGLDKPFTAVTGKEGPHRIVDRALDGGVDAGINFVNTGIVGTAQMAGEAFMRALDQPPEQIGIPPALGKLPKFLK